MPTDVLMPELSPGMEKGNVLRWLKRIGESVRPGEILLEVETDKATVEIEADVDGTLSEILIHAGATDVPIHQRLGVIADTNNGVAAPDYPEIAAAEFGPFGGAVVDRRMARLAEASRPRRPHFCVAPRTPAHEGR